MSLRLTQHDQSLVAAATRALVSPLGAPSFEDWLREVNRTLKELLWADKASFMFPLASGEIRTASDEVPSPVLQTYMREKLPQIERLWGVRKRCLQFGAFNRALIYGDDLPQMYASEYYNEYLVPHRAFDTIGMATSVESPDSVVNLYFHHDRPTGRRFGGRGLALVRMLYPAFRAGVHASSTFAIGRDGLTALLDCIAAGVALADASGRIVHKNRALLRMLVAEARRPELDALITAMLRNSAACTNERPGFSCGAEPGSRLHRRVELGTAAYVLSTTVVDTTVSDQAVGAVLIERSVAAQFPSETLRRRYKLTARELEVARLLGEGASNDEIARTLAVSGATARHHTEAVMMKLDLHARARVPQFLTTLSGHETPVNR
jgi:DNA-binding CsgD family transcriptional regulator